MTDSPIPIRPDVAVAEQVLRQLAEFTGKHGAPVAYALVPMTEDGTADCLYGVGEGVGWRSFLALAGAMLTAEALTV